jgi:hypothetical protein
MRTRLAVTWLIAVATLVGGAGVVGASSGYRRVAAQEDEVARLRTELESRGELVVTLSDKVAALGHTSCLGGTLHALHALANSDRFGALQHLMMVDGACRAAHRLLSVQRSAN